MKKRLALSISMLVLLASCAGSQPVSTNVPSLGTMSVKRLYEIFERDPASAAMLTSDYGVFISGTASKISPVIHTDPESGERIIMCYALILTDVSAPRESILCTFHKSQKDAVMSLNEGDFVKIYGKIEILEGAKYPCLDYCRIIK